MLNALHRANAKCTSANFFQRLGRIRWEARKQSNSKDYLAYCPLSREGPLLQPFLAPPSGFQLFEGKGDTLFTHSPLEQRELSLLAVSIHSRIPISKQLLPRIGRPQVRKCLGDIVFHL